MARGIPNFTIICASYLLEGPEFPAGGIRRAVFAVNALKKWPRKFRILQYFAIPTYLKGRNPPADLKFGESFSRGNCVLVLQATQRHIIQNVAMARS